MRVSAQRVFQRSRDACAASSVSKRSPFERRLLRVPDARFDFAFAIGIADAARQRDAVVGEHVPIERIERRIVDVGRDDALLQIVEHDHLDGATEPAKGLLVHARRRLNLTKRPLHTPQGDEIVLLLLVQDVAHPDEGHHRPRPRQRLGRCQLIAGFEVSLNGRIWVSTEASGFLLVAIHLHLNASRTCPRSPSCMIQYCSSTSESCPHRTRPLCSSEDATNSNELSLCSRTRSGWAAGSGRCSRSHSSSRASSSAPSRRRPNPHANAASTRPGAPR
jgi:hypothetical protein